MNNGSLNQRSFSLLLFLLFLVSNIFSQNTVDGVVWLDRNDNGQIESSDSYIDGVRIELYNSDNQLIKFTFTDDSGNYSFMDIQNGSYFIVSENIDGLEAADYAIQNSDSDINTNLTTSEFTLNGNSSESLDAGYRSSIVLMVPSQLYACQGEEVTITANVMGNFDEVTFEWDNDLSNNTSSNVVTVENDTEITLTVYDGWNIPIAKKISIHVFSGLSLKDCLIQDDFSSEDTQVSLDVVPSNSETLIDIDHNFLGIVGGERKIKFSLLEGMTVSSLNVTDMGLFISNCVDCKTHTEICYNYPENSPLNLVGYDYNVLHDITIDQGDTQITISVSDGTNTASDKIVLEARGLNSKFDIKYHYYDFDNINLVDMEKVVSVCIEVETLEGGSDLSLKGISSCAEIECQVTVPATLDICIGDAVDLTAESSCGDDGLLYMWDGVGTGNNQTVSPIVTTEYNLTVFDQRGCSRNFSVIVNVSNTPVFELVGDSNVCEGEEVTYTISHSSGTPPFTYQWNIGSDTTDQISIVITEPKTIAVTVTDGNGCFSKDSIIVVSLQNPDLLLTSLPSYCNLSTGSVTAVVSNGEPPFLYQWSNGATSESIDNVPTGNYSVSVTDSNGCSVSASAFVDNKPCAEIGNYVWEDRNYDGLQDASDSPISGMSIYLKNNDGTIIEETTTDESGYYLFSDLDAGDYQVQFESYGDFVVTKHLQGEDTDIDSDVDPVTFMSATVSLGQNEKNHSIDGGFYRPASIGDFVWNDSNNDGTQNEGEDGISGLAVKLLDCNNNSIDTTYTDESGQYLFFDLVPGEYTLNFCDTIGFSFTEQFVSSSDLDSDVDVVTGMTDCKELLSGDSIVDCDAGLVQLATIGDYVWLDNNVNGLQDSGEVGLPDIVLHLHSCDGEVLATTTTDNSGFYQFEYIQPDDYYISVTYPDGYHLTTENVGTNDEVDSDFASNGQTTCTTLSPGENDMSFDLGLFELASLGDYVWLDSNVNGIQDEDDTSSLSGFTIKLFDCDGTLLDSTVTNEEGLYLFDDLIPGQYMISAELTDSMKFTTYNEGNSSLDSDISPDTGFSLCEDLHSGEQNLDLDIGIVFLTTIGDYVWLDEDADGTQDPTEEGVEDILIYLYSCDGGLIATTTSEANGQWIFENIPYGEYEIVVDVPEPYSATSALIGNYMWDSNLDPETNSIECFLIETPVDTTIDIGLVNCSLTSGVVWLDAVIDNGILDDTENGINGLTVSMYRLEMNTWSLFATTVTKHIGEGSGLDGYWEYCLPPGSYYFHFEQFPNLVAVDPNQGSNDDLDSEITNSFGLNTTDIIYHLPGDPQSNINAGFKLQNSILGREVGVDVSTIKNLISKNSNAKVLEIDIFPNPSLDKVYIEVKNSEHKPEIMQILNSTGGKIQFSNQTRVEENGVYIIEITVDVPGCHFIDLLIGDEKKTVSFIRI